MQTSEICRCCLAAPTSKSRTRQHEQVVKVHPARFLQFLAVERVDARDRLVETEPCSCPGELLRIGQVVLKRADARHDRPRLVLLGIDPEVSHAGLDERGPVRFIIDHKLLLVPQFADVLPQDTDAGRMERADPEPVQRDLDHPLHALPHFVGSLVRKCDSQDIAGIDVSFADQVRDPAGDHPSLAAACACEDQERPVAVQNSLTLRRIEIL